MGQDEDYHLEKLKLDISNVTTLRGVEATAH